MTTSNCRPEIRNTQRNGKVSGIFRNRRAIGASIAVMLLFASVPAAAAVEDIAQVPLFLTQAVPPIAIIDMPKDQSLFTKAYNDYSDLNNDGTIETTYNNSIDYAGYFDNGICYTYTAANRFEPTAIAVNHYCTGMWSGNFLNWVTMSRMDIVRQILYGGKRSVDLAGETVLERAYLPPDAHSWAKYYNGDDIAELTPFSATNGINGAPPFTTSTHPCNVNGNCTDTEVKFPSNFPLTTDTYCGTGSYAKLVFGALKDQIFYVGDQVKIYPGTTQEPAHDTDYMIGGVCSVGTDSDGNGSVTVRVDQNALVDPDPDQHQNWVLENLSQTGISFCNTTVGTGLSQDNTNPPLMRVARGNYALWAANELWQCQWSEDKNNLQIKFAGFRSNGNRAAFSGLNASAENPSKLENGLGDLDYHVAIQACVSGYIVSSRCKKYVAGSDYYKPIGLLQQYGDPGNVRFGLFTGSYVKNFSGGVLRSNVKDWSSEIDANGSFTGGGIVDTLDKLRIYGFSYTEDNHYLNDGCGYQITDPLTNGEGNCKSWGNPISEIYLESLRYLAGQDTATSAFSVTTPVLGLQVATWQDPLVQKNFCSALDVLVFNTSVATYDDDQMGGLSNIDGGKSAADWTNEIGVAEGITGDWFVGNAGGSTIDALCTAKAVSNLGSINGICPEAPSQHGSWLIDGAAYWAHTNRIRSDLTVPDTDTSALKVDTYGIQLAASVPRITVDVGGKTVTILPAYRLDKSSEGSGPFGTGTLVDFKVINQTATEGSYYINWEDSTQGGDFDQDMWGILSYTVSGDTITVMTDAVSASTSNGQGFGYIISGTSEDGPHFYSGIYGFDYSGECTDCQLEESPVSHIYTTGETSAGSLKDPLYYAAKWGGFKDNNSNKKADQQSEWDADGDGRPDNYFFANNPSKLYEVLNKALKRVVRTESSATSIATNSTRLDTESAIYQGRFKSGDWYGELIAFKINMDGTIGSILWNAADTLDAQGVSRTILTWNPGSWAGKTFGWGNLTCVQQRLLDENIGTDCVQPTGDTLGQDRVDYLWGDQSQEILNGGSFRNRVHILGDIVNSNPFYVNDQDYRYFSLPRKQTSTPPAETDPARDLCGSDTTIIEACTYNDFRAGYAGRTPTVYVGANDGMLHAFSANTGDELFAYVPNGVYPRLADLTRPGYGSSIPHHYFVDGSVNVGDAWFAKGAAATAWHTVLVGSLGAGGKGVYALDITDPDTFGADDILWEYDGLGADKIAGTSDDDADLGYTIGQPTIVRLNDGNWYALFANGYESATHRAVLYLIRLDAQSFSTSTVYKVVGSSTTTCTIDGQTVNNGLSTPIPVDVVTWSDVENKYVAGSDRVTDYVYAGDLCGELIKFDLTDINQNWGTGKVIFTATDDSDPAMVQPITSRPDVGSSPQGGYLIYFGTGSFFRNGDNYTTDFTTRHVDSFYAIRDYQDHVVVKSELVKQTIIYQSTQNNKMLRAVSDNEVDYSSPDQNTLGKMGWYLNLVAPDGVPRGERVVSQPLLRGGRIIFTTLIPAPEDEPCKYGGSGWLMEINATTGGRPDQLVFDLNDDGLFDESDYVMIGDEKVVVSGQKSTIGIISTPGIIEAGGTEYSYFSGSSGNVDFVATTNSSGHGRKSWKEIQ